ncbi:MAG: hypothetical protein D9V47_10660 [Clostridia bacterium]|nr:MAG: hypothetical protein D9V47_10660 [Clostridia bacterium]
MKFNSIITSDAIAKYVNEGYWRNMTLADYLWRAEEVCPDKVAIIEADTGKKITYGELASAVRRVALTLLAQGVKPGDVFSTQLPNSINFCIMDYALSAIGVVHNPLHMPYRGADAKFILGWSESVGVTVTSEFKGFSYPDMIKELQPDLPNLTRIWVAGGADGGCTSLDEVVTSPVEAGYPSGYLQQFRPDPNNIAWLAYTSGTEAQPKGVMRTHNMMDYGARAVNEAMGFPSLAHSTVVSDIVVFPMSPAANIFALCGVYISLQNRGTLIVSQEFKPTLALESIEKYGVTHLMGVPTQIIAMLREPDFDKYRLNSVRVYMYAGSVCPAQVVEETRRRIGCSVVTCYALTECVICTRTLPTDPVEVTAETAGKPAPGMEVKIVDPHGNRLPPGQPGEIMAKGVCVMAGYLKRPDLTAKAFDAEGFLHTGDEGIIDESGNLRVTGRIKDIIIRGGQNISAKEVEGYLLSHPKVVNAAVVAMPDPKYGEKACAFVVPREGEIITLEEITQHMLAQGVAKYKLPERVEIVSSIPMTPAGKVQKYILREQIARKLQEEAS